MFKYVLIGDDKMIFCREEDFSIKKIKKAIEDAFPGILKWFSFFIKTTIDKVSITVVDNYEMHSSRFDGQVSSLKKGNDWDNNPFIALWLFKKEGKTYCDAKAISI